MTACYICGRSVEFRGLLVEVDFETEEDSIESFRWNDEDDVSQIICAPCKERLIKIDEEAIDFAMRGKKALERMADKTMSNLRRLLRENE